MFDYLAKFNSLAPEIKEKVSNAFALKTIEDLEKKYKVDLAGVVMRVMVKEVKPESLAIFLAGELNLGEENSEILAKEMKEKVFLPVADYLGMSLDFLPAKEEKKAPSPQVIDEHVAELEQAAKEVTDKLADKSGTELKPRLLNISRLYIRGVRSLIDTRDILSRSILEGGLNFSSSEADDLVSSLDQKKSAILKKKTEALKNPQTDGILEKINKLSYGSSPLEAGYDLRKALDTKYELKGGLDLSHELKAPLKEETTEKEAAPVAPLREMKETLPPAPVVVPPVIKEAPKPEIKKEVPVPAPVKPAPTFVPKISAQSPTPFGIKPKMEDIRRVKIMNPIDELRFMDIINFRRLSKDPKEIQKKIYNRIKLLESEDYEKGLAAITAWRQSPVNKTYLKMVKICFNEGLSISQAIENLKNKNQEYLNQPEFEAIVELNNSLRF